MLGNNGGVPVAADADGDHRPEEPGADRELQDPLRQRRTGVLPGLAVPGCYDVLGVGRPEAHRRVEAAPDEVLDEIARPYQDYVGTLPQ